MPAIVTAIGWSYRYFMGMATKTIKIAPSVIAASFRTPPMLAKIATSIDLATNGRFICGLGAGWYDKEYEAHGYPFPPLKQRLEQLEAAEKRRLELEALALIEAKKKEVEVEIEVPPQSNKYVAIPQRGAILR